MRSVVDANRIAPFAGIVLGAAWAVLALWPSFQAAEIRRATAGAGILLVIGLVIGVVAVVGATGGSARLLRLASLYSIALSTIGIVRLPETNMATTGILVGFLVLSTLIVFGIGRKF